MDDESAGGNNTSSETTSSETMGPLRRDIEAAFEHSFREHGANEAELLLRRFGFPKIAEEVTEAFERRCFKSVEREEKSKFHTVSCSEERRTTAGETDADPASDSSGDVVSSDIEYTSPDLPQGYQDTDWSYLGAARFIPEDGRIKLAFDLRWLSMHDRHKWRTEKIRERWNQPPPPEHLLQKAGTMMQGLQSFCDEIRKRGVGDFIILDADPSKPGFGYVGYRMGETKPIFGILQDKMREECDKLLQCDEPVDLPKWLSKQQLFRPDNSSQTAPWRRIIFCQGLSLAEKPPYPFLVFHDNDDPVKKATKFHLSCKRRGGSDSTNPYSNAHNGFHITFYEILEADVIVRCYEKNLKVGSLYQQPGDDPKDLIFQQTSFTMLATGKPRKRQRLSRSQVAFDNYWTILLLSPSCFFPGPTERHPEMEWAINVTQASKQTAELACVVYALKGVEARWRRLNDYIADLLTEDFMNPEAYTQLLFDDETLSRSRLYFWLIRCLIEFDVSIGDNIKQWQLFRAARVGPVLPEPDPTQLQESDSDLLKFEALDKEARDLRQSLEDLRSDFRNKLTTVQALRDGLFSASALNESRSSIRLAQNVQWLTYVSIFYLPLAFCAALWAIPHITDSGTRSPFIITAVILVSATYVTVFNLGTIVGIVRRKYRYWRTSQFDKMQNDRNQRWGKLRKEFEEFPPNNDRKTPSEWWIAIYQMRRLFGRNQTMVGSAED